MTALTTGYWTGMQVGFGDSDNEDEDDVQRAPTSGFSAGMQTEFGESGTQDEEDVHRALNSMLYETIRQAQRGSCDTQDEDDVVRALREGFCTGMQAGAGNSGTQVEEDVQ